MTEHTQGQPQGRKGRILAALEAIAAAPGGADAYSDVRQVLALAIGGDEQCLEEMYHGMLARHADAEAEAFAKAIAHHYWLVTRGAEGKVATATWWARASTLEAIHTRGPAPEAP